MLGTTQVWSVSPSSTATLVQHNIHGDWYGPTQATCSFDANLTPGTTLVAISQIGTMITGVVTDTGGHTWTQQAIVSAFAGAGSDDFSASVCTAPNTSSGSCSVTVTWSGQGTTNVPRFVMLVAEIANGEFHDVTLQHCQSFTSYTLTATDPMVGDGGIALGWASQVAGDIVTFTVPPEVEHYVPSNPDYGREAYLGLAELDNGETLATQFTVDNGYWSFTGASVAFKAKVSAEFSPADITGLTCWYDPSDAATITLSGADITGVADKGGADFDLTTAGTVAQGTQYGLDTFDFGFATGNFEYNGGNTVIAGLQCSAVQVFKRIGGSGPRGLGMFAASGDDWNSAGGAAILGTDPSYPGCYRNSGQKSYANPAATWNDWHVAMSIFDGINHTMYLDGVAATPAASTDTFATVRLRVGAGSYSDRWVGEMGDVLLYEHALDATERADLLTYLRAKWMPVPQRINGLVGWWDASDAASFTFSSGSAVSQWQDKMGDDTRHHFAQATSGQQPQRTGTLNGLPTVVFDGTRQMTTGEWLPGISHPSIWVVTEVHGNGGQRQVAPCRWHPDV